MSKVFVWLAFLFSLLMIFVGVTAQNSKPYVLIFWIAIGLLCSYKLFLKK